MLSITNPCPCRLPRCLGCSPPAVLAVRLPHCPSSIQGLTGSTVYLLMVLQRPNNWRAASAGLAQAMAGNGTFVMDATELVFGGDMARQAVSCNDNAPFKVPPAEEVVDAFLDVFHNVSRLGLAVVTTEPDAGCQYWPVTPPERFQGPWNHTLSSPILILSNSVRPPSLGCSSTLIVVNGQADPVTPISSGKLVNKLLGSSSRLLVQESPGVRYPRLPAYDRALMLTYFRSTAHWRCRPSARSTRRATTLRTGRSPRRAPSARRTSPRSPTPRSSHRRPRRARRGSAAGPKRSSSRSCHWPAAGCHSIRCRWSKAPERTSTRRVSYAALVNRSHGIFDVFSGTLVPSASD